MEMEMEMDGINGKHWGKSSMVGDPGTVLLSRRFRYGGMN